MLIRKNFKLMSLFLLLSVLILSSLSILSAASSYSRSVPAYTFGQQTTPFTGGQSFAPFDRSMCQAGQDFILQIDPLGCTPSVVRSDLLEEQEVVVFCPIYATQLNPLIKIKDIDHLIITSRDLPREVLTVGYHPARAALGRFDPKIENQFFENIGYATIVLRQQKNESAMPDFVQGNLTARMVYDIDNAFGTGRAVYYLPQLTDEEWSNDFAAYGFWDSRGYLRLEGSDNNGATIGIYSDRDITGTGKTGEKTKTATLNLEKGGKSQEVSLPGFNYCMGGLEVKLDGLENPGTRARLMIDSEVLELKKGDKFLENKCQIRNIIKQGINQKVEISCQEDERKNTFSLRINPKINLSINGVLEEHGVGDFLYSDGDSSVYLGFIGNSGKINSVNDLYIRAISIPRDRGGTQTRLSEAEISYVADYDRAVLGSDIRGIVGETSEFGRSIFAKLVQGTRAFFTGKKLGYLYYSSPGTNKLFNADLAVIGYSGAYDADLSQMPEEVKDNYEKAIEDYETIKESYSGERYPSNDAKTMGEQALAESIKLADNLGQRRTAFQLCQEYSENYDSVAPQVCSSEYFLANTQISSQSALINGKTHVISFEGIREPSFEEFGLEVVIGSPDGTRNIYQLSKNEVAYLDYATNDYIQLIDLEEDSATFKTSLSGATLRTPTQKLEIGSEETFGSKYSFSIQKINLQKVAKVSLSPQVDYARTNATFSFKIGIEKRGIQLSPEKTKQRIQDLNETIEKWTKISDGLGKVVEVGKTACLATGAALTIKNFFSNLGGKGIARQTVMRADGVGWYDKCQEKVQNLEYESVEACLLANSDAIDDSVSAYDAAITQQNQEQGQLEEGISNTKFLGEKVVNTDTLAERLMSDSYRTEIARNVQDAQITGITVGSKLVNVNEIIPYINTNTSTITQARNLQINSRLLDSSDETVRSIARSQTEKILGEIYSNSRAEATRQTYISNYGVPAIIGATTPLREYPLTQVNTFADMKNQFTGANIPSNSYVTVFVDQSTGKEYLLVLNNDFVITQTYSITNKALSVADEQRINPLGISLKKYDTTSYNNKYVDPQVRYYETDPYQGLPSIVPFDIEKGWYAAVKSNLPLLGGLKAYDDSGRVSSFYVCNVGPNGREENIGGDDVCRGFVPEAGQAPDFPGLDSRESAAKMDQAVRAIRAATDAYGAGVSQITINNQRIKVGEPAANIPDIQCEDFMSPSDCNLMFNVCDPVVCPSSRCDLGGAYPVKDVIQSGIAGSLALCLPNWPEVKVPICVSGVHAGLEGYLSVLNSYQQCLQTSLDTGQTVGICDELNSVYMCEFFWRQGLPLAKYVLPKVVGSVVGGVSGNHGGGEYLGVSEAMSTAEKSVNYFSQYYAANSFAAFKARSAEAAGGEICRNWISIAGPKGNLFDALTAPDSPSQFYGRFEEVPYTTTTNPPASQYKVFYHIYAGKDLPAYYQVYLRGTGSSFFQDTNLRRPVASGFIPAGNFRSETKDFTAPTGYKELCIVVNGQEVCGFKQVTTEFGINYLSEQYVAQQASQTDIKSEAECVSGNPSAFSFLNPNIQAGAEEALNPAIYNRGIIRVCSTGNPGMNTDPTRWSEVGNCGSDNLKCWLDSDSVKNVVRNADIEGQILGEIENNTLNALQAEGQYIADFDAFKEEINELTGKDSEIIDIINRNIEKIFYNNQRAYLHLIRGNAYSNLASRAYNIAIGELKTETRDEVTEIPTDGTTTPTSSTCSTQKGCQKILGAKVIQLAQQKKAARSISDDSVKRYTGAKSFECLVLQVAMVESTIQHCRQTQVNGNPLYCEGNINDLISGDEFDSLGIMQINKEVHGEKLFFNENVNYAIDLLINGYNPDERQYVCNGKIYGGWTRSLRQYNGWSTTDNIDCSKGNPNYVEDVINQKDEVADLFSECA